jgi:CrcB protein
MSTAIWVALGGAVGSLARFGLAGAINYRGHPWGTVAVNIVGSFVLGLVVGAWGFHAEGPRQIGLAVGLLGGFTTFSSFALDTIYLWENGEIVTAVTSVAISVVVGLAAAVAGLLVGRSFA